MPLVSVMPEISVTELGRLWRNSQRSLRYVDRGDEFYESEDAVTNSKGETIQFSKIAAKGAAFRLMEELGTEPRVYYLPPVNRKYPSPVEKHVHDAGSA